jgi:8-oxo-dGTP diphosphatase
MIYHLATGLALVDGRILLVASSYANHVQPIWNLPGGRQQPGELLTETAVREVFEETGLSARVREVAYVSESYDGDDHFVNVTFGIDVRGELRGNAGADDHVTEAAWIPIEQLHARMQIAVVREPLAAYLRGALSTRYAGFHDAGVTIRWPAGSS